eukprot:363299-Chlamydomonas_euryale.AAC.6
MKAALYRMRARSTQTDNASRLGCSNFPQAFICGGWCLASGGYAGIWLPAVGELGRTRLHKLHTSVPFAGPLPVPLTPTLRQAKAHLTAHRAARHNACHKRIKVACLALRRRHNRDGDGAGAEGGRGANTKAAWRGPFGNLRALRAAINRLSCGRCDQWCCQCRTLASKPAAANVRRLWKRPVAQHVGTQLQDAHSAVVLSPPRSRGRVAQDASHRRRRGSTGVGVRFQTWMQWRMQWRNVGACGGRGGGSQRRGARVSRPGSRSRGCGGGGAAPALNWRSSAWRR